MQHVKKFLIMTLITSILAACNTIHGAGEDISSGGTAISKTATKVQAKM